MMDEMMTVSAECLPDTAENSGDITAMSEVNQTDGIAADNQTEACTKIAVQGDEDGLMQSTHEGDVYMPVYNGEVRPIRANDREEITALLQLGMKQRDFLPQYERLARMAADAGEPSVKALIDRLWDRQEETMLDEAVAAYGEEHGKRIYDLERRERERRYEDRVKTEEAVAENEQQQVAARLAGEFLQLQKEYPSYTDIRALPDEVLSLALQNGITLLDAQNRFTLAEQQRQQQNAALQAAAAKASTGALSHYGDTPPSAMNAFLSGLHSRA